MAWDTLITNVRDSPQKSEKQTQIHINRPLFCFQYNQSFTSKNQQQLPATWLPPLKARDIQEHP